MNTEIDVGNAEKGRRVVFLDWLRIIACFMVMLVHTCEPFYFDADGNTFFQSKNAAFWASWLDSLVRCCVPLFVMASSYLLFPVTRPTGEFFRRRLVRVFVPYVVWLCVYTAVWGEWGRLPFNFPFAGGHLWFVYMLMGLYLLMPLLSPWAEKASEREVRGWLLLWLATTLFPFIRLFWLGRFGAPEFGPTPFLWGEAPWNRFGAFYYVSGFFGYMLLGFYFRKFVPDLGWRRTLALALPLWVVGMAIVWGGFYFRIPDAQGYPVARPYAFAVDLETSWEFCGFGVALMTVAYFLLIRKLDFSGGFYRRVVRPLSEASYGTYLLHMLILVPVVDCFRQHLPPAATMITAAVATYVLASAAGVVLRRIPFVGRFIVG